MLIPSPILELLELNWLDPVRVELELPSFELESELHLTELGSELPSMELKSDMRSLIQQWPTTVLASSFIEKANTSCLHITGPN